MIIGSSVALSSAGWLATRDAVFLESVNPYVFLGVLLFLMAVYGAFAVYWTREVFRFDPALVVDSFGILDHRLGPDPIPWDMIYDIKLRGSRGRPFLALSVDVLPGQLSRVSGFRRYFMPPSSPSDDRKVHISLTGLAVPPTTILQAVAEVLMRRGNAETAVQAAE